MDFLQECTRRRESQFHGVVVYKHFSLFMADVHRNFIVNLKVEVPVKNQ